MSVFQFHDNTSKTSRASPYTQTSFVNWRAAQSGVVTALHLAGSRAALSPTASCARSYRGSKSPGAWQAAPA
eukprot:scaffold857_cov63-Phaeocystis_antarctica.AAC.2